MQMSCCRLLLLLLPWMPQGKSLRCGWLHLHCLGAAGCLLLQVVIIDCWAVTAWRSVAFSADPAGPTSGRSLAVPPLSLLGRSREAIDMLDDRIQVELRIPLSSRLIAHCHQLRQCQLPLAITFCPPGAAVTLDALRMLLTKRSAVALSRHCSLPATVNVFPRSSPDAAESLQWPSRHRHLYLSQPVCCSGCSGCRSGCRECRSG